MSSSPGSRSASGASRQLLIAVAEGRLDLVVSVSDFPLRLSASIKLAAAQLAHEDGISLNQLIATSVAEKVGALRTAGYLEERAKRADRAVFDDVLARASRAPVKAGRLCLATSCQPSPLT